MQDDRRASTARPTSQPRATASAGLSPSILQDALTPRGLFTNLFPVSFASTNLGVLRRAPKAKKEDFDDRRRPRFYQLGTDLYAYGPGLDEFKDPRFTPAIVAIEQEPYFTQHLMKYGLVDFFRQNGYLVRPRQVGFALIDHHDVIASAQSGVLHICPEYAFQPLRVEGADGTPIYAFAIEPGWATVPAFEIGTRLARHSERLEGIKLLLRCSECGPHCQLHDRLNEVVGVFEAFAEDGVELTSSCRCEDYTPQPIVVRQRLRQKRSERGNGKRAKAPERTIIVPGQVVKPASGQRRVLQLFQDRRQLEMQGRVWLGDLTSTGKVRSGALRVRYERVQHFLARVADHETEGISFPLPTGPMVTLERSPVTAEELTNA
jgi:hypothetical protein